MYTENFLTNQLGEKFENRSTVAKVINKHQVAYFARHTVYKHAW